MLLRSLIDILPPDVEVFLTDSLSNELGRGYASSLGEVYEYRNCFVTEAIPCEKAMIIEIDC